MVENTVDKSISQAEPEAGKAPRAKTTTRLGKGLDIGTTNLVCAVNSEDGQVLMDCERNAFLDIKSDPFTRSLLTEQRVPYVAFKNAFLVLGQAAFEFANIVGREVRRPMRGGLISSKEVDALPVVKLLLEKLVGAPRRDQEPLCFSLPAAPVDSTLNVDYHKGILSNLMSRFGYRAFPIDEGLAVVYSDLAEEGFTGIGLSFGGGMVNVTLAYRSVPALSFSVGRSGDWIDHSAAEALGIKATRVTLIRERGMDIRAPKSREEEAVAIFYRNLIRYVGEQIRDYIISSERVPALPSAIDSVCAGGTALAGGFIDVVKEEFEQVRIPVPLRAVRLARSPLDSTARGCLVAASRGG